MPAASSVRSDAAQARMGGAPRDFTQEDKIMTHVYKAAKLSDLLANYQTFLGDANFLEKDFARYYAVTPATIHAAARRRLHDGHAVMRVTPMPKYADGKPVR